MDASRDYEVLDPQKQFGDWNASWTKFKFPSRQSIKPVSIPIPPFPPAYMCPRFQAPHSPELHFPSFVLKLPPSLHWPHFAGGRETSSGWMLFVAAGHYTLQSEPCAELWISLHKDAVILRASNFHPSFEGKEWSNLPYQKGSLGMEVGLRAFGDVSWFLLGAQVRHALAVRYKEFKK